MNLERHQSLDERFDPAVRVVEYDRMWAERAEVELNRVKQALGPLALRLEHVGSTAVPGLAAKPILDLLVSVQVMEPRACYEEPLERLGYLFVPDPEWPDFPLFAKPPERPRSYHLRICAGGSKHEARHIAVRDFLRAHAEEAARYAALKRALAERIPYDRLAYIAGKEHYVKALEGRALASRSIASRGG